MKKNKGFTLIELLAVLLILAIIALIVTPIISKIIGTAKDSADRRSVERYVRAAQSFYMESQVDEAKKNLLGTNILENLDLEDIEATGSIVAYPDGNVEMAIIYNSKCYTKTITQSIKNIEMSTDTSNCIVMSSSVKVSSIESGDSSIIINLDNSADTSITMTSCKYGTSNGEYNLDGQISGNTCTLSPTEVGTRYYYEIVFSDGSKRSGSVQGGAGTVTPSNQNGGGTSTGGSGTGSGSGSGSTGGGVAAPIMEGENGQTYYTGTYLANVKTIYWDVTNGVKCSVSAWSSNAGNTSNSVNTGCLRFYAYMEDNLSYTAILDRNTSGPTHWASSGSNGAGPVTASAKLKADTKDWNGTITPKNYVYVLGANPYEIPYDTDGYKARFITMDEIAHITRKENFNVNTASTGSWFYLDGYAATESGANWQTRIATSSQKSAFYWLYNNLANCINYGGYNNHNSMDMMGYWTSDAIYGTTNYAWEISYVGRASHFYTDSNSSQICINCGNAFGNTAMGIRPVVTILKSALD